MENRPDDFIPTRASLVGRLKNWQDEQSWQEFLHIYRRLLFSLALKSGLTPAEAEDVVQETLISVAKTIQEFHYDRTQCTFKSWLRHLTQKRIADRYRKRARELKSSAPPTAPTSATSPLERLPDPASLDLDAVWDTEWRQQLLEAAIERVKTQASPEQFQIFDFYVLRNMPVKKVAAALDVSVAQVYLVKHRLSQLLKKEVRRLESRMG